MFFGYRSGDEAKKKDRDRSGFWIVVFPLLLASSLLGLFPGHVFALKVPEVLRYDLTWAGIKAGEASLEVTDEGAWVRITSTARSAKWLSLFYTVDDRVESRLSKDGSPRFIGRPMNYRLTLREGRHRKNKEVIFDSRNSKVTYIDYLAEEKKELKVPAFTLDPLSSFFYLRTLDLKVGKPVYVTIFDSKKVWNVEVQVLRRERIEVPAGVFDTILVKPLMKSEGIFYRKGEIFIWLTDDEKRIPVMLKSKVKVGSIKASLVGGIY
jgi:hypothetical protein